MSSKEHIEYGTPYPQECFHCWYYSNKTEEAVAELVNDEMDTRTPLCLMHVWEFEHPGA